MNRRLVVGIPTIGRASVLCETLAELALQTLRPDSIIVCATQASDVNDALSVSPAICILMSQPGLARQRNAIIRAAGNADFLVFFDDDFLPHPGYLQSVTDYMAMHPSCVIVTGTVLVDGINGPGLSPAQGRAVLGRCPAIKAGVSDRTALPTFNGYGCNMAVRLAPVREHALRFDERLPLYGWQEDVDFSCRIAAFGKVMRLTTAVGVHLGVKSGRGSGVRLGYSQVANPLYLTWKKCGYPLSRALIHIARNVAINLVRSLRPEPHIDRRGRLHGNFLAVRDLLLRQICPERILDV